MFVGGWLVFAFGLVYAACGDADGGTFGLLLRGDGFGLFWAFCVAAGLRLAWFGKTRVLLAWRWLCFGMGILYALWLVVLVWGQLPLYTPPPLPSSSIALCCVRTFTYLLPIFLTATPLLYTYRRDIFSPTASAACRFL